ncbi:MAG: L-rhamnose/proton symporter RhaT [Candidatus Daviesbacteria bacterium]|nr:L-rhamnose/proton symporter RhaT [Candidatus Daviesbacteria bacterium]
MNEFTGFLLVLIAGFTQGTVGALLRYTKPLRWENFWGIYVFLAFVVGPVMFAKLLIPNFDQLIFSIPPEYLYLPLLFGAIWGLGNVLFGISLVRIGLSLTSSIIIGLVVLLGSILPIFINHVVLTPSSLIFLIAGLVIVITGVGLSGYSGMLRDKGQNVGKGIVSGIIIAILGGIFSSMLNVGFVTGKNIALLAEESGVSNDNSSLLIWVVAIFAGFLVNIVYVIYLLFKNKSLNVYKKITWGNILTISAAAIFWYASFALFGIAAGKLGKLGPSVGWAMLLSLSIIISNLWGIKFGEWKNSKVALGFQLKSLGLIILGIVLIAISALS